MSLLDLSQVSQTLNRLLRKYLSQPHLWGMNPEETPPAVSVTGDPPDLLAQQTENYALGLYLCHIEEDSHRKNFPAPADNSPPVRFQEIALNLQYLLTAHGGTPTVGDAMGRPYLREQRIMGLAVKAFHDYPVIDDKTRIGPAEEDPQILPEALREKNNEFRITLLPGSLEDIHKIWSAANSPFRLSALYQVDVVMLEAEPTVSRPTPVLFPHLSACTFPLLWLRGTESDCYFTLPGESVRRRVIHSPALVSMGQSFRILGENLISAPTEIFLAAPDWKDPPCVKISSWVRNTSSLEKLELQVMDDVSGINIVPGLYQIYLQRGNTVSNKCTLAVAARVNSDTDVLPGIVPPGGAAGTAIVINGGPFAGEGIESLSVCVGSLLLHQSEELAVPGSFRVLSETELSVVIPGDLTPGNYVVRVVVNDISTPPNRWFEVTP